MDIQPIPITLSSHTSDIQLGRKIDYSINDKGIIIHVNNSNNLKFIQSVARKIDIQGINYVKLVGKEWNLDKIWAFWLGYRQEKRQNSIIWSPLGKLQQTELNNRLKTIDWVRSVINMPASELSPEQLASSSLKLLTDIGGNKVSYQFIKGQELFRRHYFGLYNVGQGSSRLPVMLALDYNPTGDANAPFYACLVGKGITFDSGGYSIKPTRLMSSMKADMGGAALVTGSLALAISRGLNRRVKLILCCADNLISSKSYKIGDIIHYRNGKTVEVTNTDAEGRLVLADGLIDSDMLKPKIIIDCATLTGAAKTALGNDYHAVFSFDNDLMHRFSVSAEKEKEAFWRLPLADFHRDLLHSDFAEISNSCENHPAGASVAAGFLSHFLENPYKGWIHLDCSATYHKFSTEHWSVGATGIGVLTLARFLIENQDISRI